MAYTEPGNSGVGDPQISMLARMVSRVENGVDGLAEKVERLQITISQDQKEMREAFRAEVRQVDQRVAVLEHKIAQMDVTNKILTAIGAALLVGLLGMAVPRIWGPVPQHPAIQQTK